MVLLRSLVFRTALQPADWTLLLALTCGCAWAFYVFLSKGFWNRSFGVIVVYTQGFIKERSFLGQKGC